MTALTEKRILAAARRFARAVHHYRRACSEVRSNTGRYAQLADIAERKLCNLVESADAAARRKHGKR